MRMRVRFSGHVQGVGFRATARAIASRFPVTGWVRNEPDGAVLMEVQGEADAAAEVVAEIRRVMARNIRQVDEAAITDSPNETGFSIAR